MKTLVVYDSAFGNTALVARAIADALQCGAVLINDFDYAMLDGVDLLVIGTPTQGGMATKPIQQFIQSLSSPGPKVAVFDTRFDIDTQGFWLKLLMRVIGFAAEKMADQISAQKLTLVDKPVGFIVNEKSGPLREGEIERAKAWAVNLI